MCCRLQYDGATVLLTTQAYPVVKDKKYKLHLVVAGEQKSATRSSLDPLGIDAATVQDVLDHLW